jgi:ABC-type lipoprotein export system ATPase subunit
MPVLEVKQLSKVYGQKWGATHKALREFDLTIEEGEFVGVMGPSGSGKTTLLQLIGTIDQPTSGKIFVRGKETTTMNSKELATFRRQHLGFIFQDYQLLNSLTLKENIMIPLILEKKPIDEIEARLTVLAERLGIEQVLHHYPYEVSGGQKQRAAAARALIHQPDLILADEPTGNLDSKAAKALMESLVQLNQTEQATIMTVTHDPFTASYCSRVIFIKDGMFFNQIQRGEDRQTFFQQIMQVLSRLGGESHEFANARL